MILLPSAEEHKGKDYCRDETENILPYEKRSLNFLIGEYLLQHDYKLTAITFSEETSDQVWLFRRIITILLTFHKLRNDDFKHFL